MTTVEKIKEFLENELNNDELVEVWNDYCDLLEAEEIA